ncbi:hypothetical protein HS7_14900 [Sulfolobales archaeon HS-7]|nr:hypothetical protein HS7_14900 [Sulfolobales archaeon HS-7]
MGSRFKAYDVDGRVVKGPVDVTALGIQIGRASSLLF